MEDFVIINGQKVEMETKLCHGGCGMTFRVMKGSNHEFARADCDSVCRGIVPGYEKIRAVKIKEQKEALKKIKEQRRNILKAFDEAIDFCKDLKIKGDEDRFIIAQKALEVSFTRSDSKEVKSLRSGLSAARFARSVNVAPKTLLMWMRIKRLIVDRIGLTVYNKGTYRGAMRAVRSIEPGTEVKVIEEIFLRESDKAK